MKSLKNQIFYRYQAAWKVRLFGPTELRWKLFFRPFWKDIRWNILIQWVKLKNLEFSALKSSIFEKEYFQNFSHNFHRWDLLAIDRESTNQIQGQLSSYSDEKHE